MSNSSHSTTKCLICYSHFQSEPSENPQHFSAVFGTFCHLLQIDLTESMRWNFEQDDIPFCETCCYTVVQLKSLRDQAELIQHQINTVLQTTKSEILNSSIQTIINVPQDRVDCFRHLVNTGSTKIEAEATCSNVNLSNVKVETELDGDTRINLKFLERINEPCRVEDYINESDPLDVKPEINDSTHNESGLDPIFLDPDDHSRESVSELDKIRREKWLERQKGYYRKRIQSETPEQREGRLKRMRDRAKSRRKTEDSLLDFGLFD